MNTFDDVAVDSHAVPGAHDDEIVQWYPDKASAEAKLAELEALGDGKQYLVDLSLTRENPSAAENFGSSNPVQLRS